MVWICHFSNPKVREYLPLSKRKLANLLRHCAGKRPLLYTDFAPWITSQIEAFESIDDVELHVIAPHSGLRRLTYEFSLNGIYYHFFRKANSTTASKIFMRLSKSVSKNYIWPRYIVKKYINKINPDIVNLIGTENPDYSITSLDIKDRPIFVSVQTVYTNPDRIKLTGYYNPLNWEIELKIHTKEKYFGCTGRMHRDLILKNNPAAIIFKYFFAIEKPAAVKEFEKFYDFVFFAATIVPKKGIEEALAALAIVKRKKNDVLLNIVGRCTPEYKDHLLSIINKLELKENVIFNDYFISHIDMFQHLKRSKFAVLPNKIDVISGTIVEAMLLGLPIVTTRTTGTPYLNKDGETVLLTKIGNINELAEKMLLLLTSPEKAEELGRLAKAFAEREFDNAVSAQRLVKIYRAVFEHYWFNKQIPNELLFNLAEFPVY